MFSLMSKVSGKVFEVLDWECRCGELIRTGIPCPHVLACAIEVPNKDLFEFFNKRWIKEITSNESQGNKVSTMGTKTAGLFKSLETMYIWFHVDLIIMAGTLLEWSTRNTAKPAPACQNNHLDGFSIDSTSELPSLFQLPHSSASKNPNNRNSLSRGSRHLCGQWPPSTISCKKSWDWPMNNSPTTNSTSTKYNPSWSRKPHRSSKSSYRIWRKLKGGFSARIDKFASSMISWCI